VLDLGEQQLVAEALTGRLLVLGDSVMVRVLRSSSVAEIDYGA
jgi:hypothetical protein